MLFGQDRNQLRQVFFTAWQKHNTKQKLEPLEQIIATVIAMHPEYWRILPNPVWITTSGQEKIAGGGVRRLA